MGSNFKILSIVKSTALVAIASLICSALLLAQVEKITFEHLKAVATPYCLLQDHYGFIWFGSRYNGLFMYDGYDFIAYRHNPDDENSSSANSVRSIAEDQNGDIWVGTVAGLNRLNRTTGKFQRFLHDPSRPDSPSSNYITTIFIDKAGIVWFGTQEGGLNKAIILKSKADGSDSLVCRHYLNNPQNGNSISHNNVKAIWAHSHQDENSLWVGTAFGLNLFDKMTEKFSRYFHDPDDSTSLSHNEIWSIHEDRSGELWIGSGDGTVSRLSSRQDAQIKFQNYKLGTNKAIGTITSDPSGSLWIGVKGHGLFRLNHLHGTITNFVHHDDDPHSLFHNVVYSVVCDKAGTLWVGRMDGIDKYDPHQKKFHHISFEPPPGKWALEITSFCEDHLGFIWIGSRGKGVFRLDPRNGKIINYNHIPGDPTSLCCPWVLTVYEDKNETLWNGTTNGLDRFDRKREIFQHLYDKPGKPDNPFALLSDYIYALYEDKNGSFWVSTPRGLSKLDRSSGRFSHYLNDIDNQIGLAGYCIGVISESSDYNDNTLWLGANGLFKFNPQTGKLSRYYHDPENSNSWINQLVYGIQQDKTGNIWVATTGGLYCLGSDKTIAHFTVKHSLPSNLVYGILEDDDGVLWISTYKGLVSYNPQSQQFRQYEMKEGFLKNEFVMGAYAKGKSGYLYFGQLNGFKMFHPQEIKDNQFIPPVWITGFKIFDQSISFDQPIPDLKEIRLSHRQNFFTLDYVALNYSDSPKNQYAYQLEGVDPAWVNAGNRRSASYTNIAPGNYIFKVMGANNDGVWNEQGASVRLIITPPWWQTGWAYAFYALIMSFIVVTLWQLQVRRIKIRNELNMRKFETQKLQEIDGLKSRFFANISHEFRTPLTLILGPLNKMLSQTKSKERKQEFKLMQRNARRLQRLINQLLDLSKIEAGKMALQARPENIVALLNRIVQSFESQAKLKGIELKFQSERDEIIVYVDREKIENIFYNLLSNALKFTAQGGAVSVNVDIPLNPSRGFGTGSSKGDLLIPTFEEGPGGMSGFIQIIVTDTGIGIPSERLDKIFDRFYQVDDSYTREHAPLDKKILLEDSFSDKTYLTGHEGSGIGLALTKELVDLHHGKIEVNSELNKGTTFTVYLPLGKEHLKPEEIIAETSAEEFKPEIPPVVISEVIEDDGKVKEAARRKAIPIVLIVEDNRDMRSYLTDCLASEYRLIEAVDGEDGLKTSIDKIPDLIISDVMMPKMDGFQLCRRLKTDERTSHIPIILLTARAATADKIGGLELGADDYLIKPFDTKELLVRVKNLIQQRRLLRKKFSQQISFVPEEIATTPVDVSFLQKAKDLVEVHIADEDFRVELLAKNIGMSRSQLHRKLRALTDHSTSEFIRTLRLQQAAYLLQQRRFSVTEVAFEVGFNNPSYFAACFRKQFGKLPSEYTQKS